MAQRKVPSLVKVFRTGRQGRQLPSIILSLPVPYMYVCSAVVASKFNNQWASVDLVLAWYVVVCFEFAYI